MKKLNFDILLSQKIVWQLLYSVKQLSLSLSSAQIWLIWFEQFSIFVSSSCFSSKSVNQSHVDLSQFKQFTPHSPKIIGLPLLVSFFLSVKNNLNLIISM